MGYNEELQKLRLKISEYFGYQENLDPEAKANFEATLIQLLNEAEKNRQTYVNMADNLKKQAAVAEGQANAFSSMSSMVSSVLNGFIIISQRNKLEEQRRQEELKEIEENRKELEQKDEAVEVPEEPAPLKKGRKNK